MAVTREMAVLSHVSHNFGTRDSSVEAVHDVSLGIESGSVSVICGESGSGKTTLLLILGGLLRPTSGNVSLFGKAAFYQQSVRTRTSLRRKQIGFMLPTFKLLPYLNVEDNIRVATNHSRAASRRLVDELLQMAGLEARRRHRPGQLSTGEQRRVMLCRALANEPQLLICDEPTSNLDKDNAARVESLIANYARQDRAVLVVTHASANNLRPTRTYNMSAGRLTQVTT